MELSHSLNEAIARKFAKIALGHVAQEYPNQPMHVMVEDSDARTPRELHPAFFGSYDWHSCVHSWWLLLTLRRTFYKIPEFEAISALAETTLSEENLAVELAYFDRPTARGFERPYGWGWLLYLHHEAERHEDQAWGARLAPLACAISKRFAEFLPLLTYPITVGTHFNTAFALLLAREWAKGRDPALLAQIDAWSLNAFASKSDYAGWEPGGDEFLSPVLTASLLMSDVMTSQDFTPWFEGLVLTNGWLERECHPVTVSDRSDGKIAHLDGLNLSRAWCLLRIGRSLENSTLTALLNSRAEAHLDAAIPHVAGDYMGEHWLASFALLALLETS
ncbi:DUF2891 domain-containing protein [uncultured Erythrobacter sp.]|uniref:DUF2891 domain-containing protein n=1 Tax=uncultured Erythrobacter sp. TaxID=263913 RepID=UPI0026097084|nr:DUF2891 domain-containing protein [uncultured Erythrobacter sp.]